MCTYYNMSNVIQFPQWEENRCFINRYNHLYVREKTLYIYINIHIGGSVATFVVYLLQCGQVGRKKRILGLDFFLSSASPVYHPSVISQVKYHPSVMSSQCDIIPVWYQEVTVYSSCKNVPMFFIVCLSKRASWWVNVFMCFISRCKLQATAV